MKYLLDANIIIRLLSQPETVQIDRFAVCDEGDLVTSAIAFAEVAIGSARGGPPGDGQLQALISEVEVLPFDLAAARHYARLPFKRRSYDRLIAAHALALGLTLITDNESDFADVPGLRIENWTLAA